MTTPEYPDGTLTPWQADHPPANTWDDGYDSGAGGEPSRKFSLRVVARAIRRHWWQILLIWGLVSGGLMTWAYLRVKPTYDATAYVQIDPPPVSGVLGANVLGSSTSVESQLETQAQRITTPDVLGPAVKDPKVAALPRIQSALDAEAAIRKELRVLIVPKTRYITISMTSTSPEEAVTIVNAVATAYDTSVSSLADADIRKQTKRLERFLDDLNNQVTDKQEHLRELVNRAEVRVGIAVDENAGNPDERDAATQIKERDKISLEEFKIVAGQVNAIELDLMEEEKRRDHLKMEQRGSKEAVKLDRAVDQELQVHPEVVHLGEDFEKARKQLERARQLVGPSDISYREAKRHMGELKDKYQAATERLRPLIRRRLERELANNGVERDIRDTEERISRLQTRREGLQKRMKDMKVEKGKEGRLASKDSLEIEIARQDLGYTRGMREQIHKQLTAMLYEAENARNKIHLTLAGISYMPSSNKRTAMMAAAPVGTLAVVLAMFVLLEVGAGRVNDPDDLPGRLHLGVIGVVPPLPPAEPAKGLPWGNNQERARRKVEEFVQSLDHLRVQLWAGRRAGAKHRCVLITSACVSEGKTTLAAQLAGRCANSGLSTLLIDADLRRPALARLLEVPGEPGLADVLSGEIEPEAAMTVIGSAGGFHLMPAGARGHDPSRLLQGERLGALLARFRETFDIIIVDAPPVLPVPDALILGRWTDGAVLAVRHDSSRYPMVERAQHKLASVGVPILGAVVNGVRGGGSAYGNYAYSSAQGDRDGAL